MRQPLYPFTLLQKATGTVLIALFLCSPAALAQPGIKNNPLTDSLKRNLSQAQADKEKNYWLLALSEYYSTIDIDLSEQYARQAMQVAELTRDRRMITNTWLQNGLRHGNRNELSNYVQLAITDFQEAQKMAQANGLDDELGYSYTGLARMSRATGDYDKALNYNTLALSIAGASGNDSLKIIAYHSMGGTYIYKNEKLLAFRDYLDALNVAELSKNDVLLAICYTKLSEFYAGIEDYDKAIDCSMQTLHIDQARHDRYSLLHDYNTTGLLFTSKKQYDVALAMFEDAIRLADSLQFGLIKIKSYLNITNMYFAGDQMSKGLAYLNNHPQVLDFFSNNGLGFFLDEGYGNIYLGMGKYDSANYFFRRAEPHMEQQANKFALCGFYMQMAMYYQKTNNYPLAISYLLKVRQMGEKMKDLNILENSTKYLDTLYTVSGDYKNAYYYNSLHNQYKDSIKALAKETDLLKLEVEDDNKRRERLAKEEEEKTQHRHNVQYMGITAGIAGLFIVMVMMGFFVVSPRTIRALGFFSFIFLFEFVILLADKQIHEWTHGEPWKILIIKIALAAILLPLHHWLEHKVMHYLTTRKKIAAQGFFAAGRLLKRKTEPVHQA